MSNTFGTIFKITTFGESHGPAIGVVIDGIESDFPIDEKRIQYEMDRRKPGTQSGATSRNESDSVEILSGVFQGKTTGSPISLLIRNKDQHSTDYDSIKDYFRPGHADYTYQKKYGIRDWRGGGRSSGRETAARVAAGAIAKQVLESKGIYISSKIVSIGGEKENFQKTIDNAQQNHDSVGGIIQCTVEPMPIGLGEPIFDKLDAEIAKAIISIGAVKGIEFGSGFLCTELLGSVNNEKKSGGTLGGISDGTPLTFQVAVKPTPSISKPQIMMKKDGTKDTVTIKGRHDTCICLRIGPVIEAMTAITLLDFYYMEKSR